MVASIVQINEVLSAKISEIINEKRKLIKDISYVTQKVDKITSL